MMKKRKTVFSLLFLLVLVAATWLVLKGIGKELDFVQMWRFIQTGNKGCLGAALLCMCFFIMMESFSLRCIYRHLGKDTGFGPSLVYAAADVYYSAITPSAAGGQPAAVFYMTRDGIPVSTGTAALLLNTVCYAASLDLIGIFTLLTCWKMFLGFDWAVQVLVLLGIVIQFVALLFCLLCMYKSDLIYKVCVACLRGLSRLRILRNAERWEEKLRDTIDQYALCISAISANRWIPIKALLFNTAQRISQILITSFVCASASTGVTFLEAMALQSFCMTGSNSIPLPGAVGAYEFLYLGTFGGVLDEITLMPSLMTARGISYYLCFMVSCVITWIYHLYTLRRETH